MSNVLSKSKPHFFANIHYIIFVCVFTYSYIQKRAINFAQLDDPSLYMNYSQSSSLLTASASTAVTTSDGQDIDFGSMVRQRQHRGLFKNGITNGEEEEEGGGCLMKLEKGGSVQFVICYKKWIR